MKRVLTKTYNYLKNKGLFTLRGLISLFIAILIFFSPAYLQIIYGSILNNNVLVAKGIALFVAIVSPIPPIGWLVFPLAIGILNLWNLILKKLKIKYK